VLLISPKEKQNSQKVSIFLSPEHLEAIRQEAEKKGTTVSGLIRMIVIEHLDKGK
jgi:predicted DNA binding CopG/RHH family protein